MRLSIELTDREYERLVYAAGAHEIAGPAGSGVGCRRLPRRAPAP